MSKDIVLLYQIVMFAKVKSTMLIVDCKMYIVVFMMNEKNDK